MANTPETAERKPVEKPERDVVTEVPEAPEIPEHLETIAQPTQTQMTAQVQDDQGKPMIQSPATQTVTVTVPADPKQLQDLSGGSVTDAITWFAMFWLRMIKKAMHFGWQVVVGNKGGGDG